MTPFSSSIVRGGDAGRAPRATAASNAAGTSSTSSAIDCDAVAVPHQPLCVGMIGAERRGQHEGDVPLAEHVTRLVRTPVSNPA